jgi:hypothetical protein
MIDLYTARCAALWEPHPAGPSRSIVKHCDLYRGKIFQDNYPRFGPLATKRQEAEVMGRCCRALPMWSIAAMGAGAL